MIHRLALVMGGTGAAGIMAVALALGGFGNQLSAAPDEFVPTAAQQALGGGQVSQPGAPTSAPNLGGGTTRKVVDTVYVLPTPDAPAADPGNKPRKDNRPAADTPSDPSTDQNDDGNADQNDDGDANEGNDGDTEDGDHANEDDPSNTGDHANEDGGHNDDGGSEPGGD